MIKNFILVGLGGGIGSMLRYAISYIPYKNFPYSTLLVNITGSFIIGLIAGLCLNNESLNNSYKIFFAIGICGGFTTFSAFALENLQLLQQGRFFIALLYISLSVIFSIIAAWSGFKLSMIGT
ncbi:MAG: fluoride efflux transporter CrcB [Chitinophagaceae bacterium]|nr:fluoride efflux transporter CrcB [Chitinophagaceae bacterium]